MVGGQDAATSIRQHVVTGQIAPAQYVTGLGHQCVVTAVSLKQRALQTGDTNKAS